MTFVFLASVCGVTYSTKPKPLVLHLYYRFLFLTVVLQDIKLDSKEFCTFLELQTQLYTTFIGICQAIWVRNSSTADRSAGANPEAREAAEVMGGPILRSLPAGAGSKPPSSGIG